LSLVEDVVQLVDVSLNSELAVLAALSDAACRRSCTHDVIVMVDLGDLRPEDVQVELYFGNLNPSGEMAEGAALPMSVAEKQEKNLYLYQGFVLCLKSGQFGFTVRMIPSHGDQVRKFIPRLITWA